MWLLNGYGTLVLFSYPQNSLETLRYCDDCTFDWLMDFLAGEKISCHLHLYLLKNGLARWWEILMFPHLTDCCTLFNTENYLTIMTLNFITFTFTFWFSYYICVTDRISTKEKLSNNPTFTSAFTEEIPWENGERLWCLRGWLIDFLTKEKLSNHRPPVWINSAVLVLATMNLITFIV